MGRETVLTLGECIRRHRFRRVKGPDGRERVEDPCTLGEVYAANAITRRELDRMRDEAEYREKRRRMEAAEQARRAREDAWADEWGASHAG